MYCRIHCVLCSHVCLLMYGVRWCQTRKGLQDAPLITFGMGGVLKTAAAIIIWLYVWISEVRPPLLPTTSSSSQAGGSVWRIPKPKQLNSKRQHLFAKYVHFRNRPTPTAPRRGSTFGDLHQNFTLLRNGVDGNYRPHSGGATLIGRIRGVLNWFLSW